MNYALCVLSTLVPTILIELGILWMLLEERPRVLWSSVVINVLTNVPLCLWFLEHDTTWTALLVAESLVFVIETLWYRYWAGKWSDALLYSFFCNSISFLMGLLFQLFYSLM